VKIVTICSGTNTAWVIQRYIRDPLLYKGRKFDIRHWVLLLHDGSMWALSDGSCRTASVPYVDGCWSNSFVHLTNHSVQVLLVAVVGAMRGVC
jgi:tubulin--tyrosine ligase